MILQTSCSELLVDTRIHDPEEAFTRFRALFAKHGWESSPPLTLELLKRVKAEGDWDAPTWKVEPVEVVVSDQRGNRAWLVYDHTGNPESGFRLGTNHMLADERCFPLLKVMAEEFATRVVDDGATTRYYEEWEAEEASRQAGG
jgi:hypothetical protein